MTDTTRTVPPIPAYDFPGSTEISRDGRSVVCCGTGPDIEAAILAWFDNLPVVDVTKGLEP